MVAPWVIQMPRWVLNMMGRPSLVVFFKAMDGTGRRLVVSESSDTEEGSKS